MDTGQNLKATGRTGPGKKTGWTRQWMFLSLPLTKQQEAIWSASMQKCAPWEAHWTNWKCICSHRNVVLLRSETWWDSSPDWRAAMDRHRLLGNAGKKGEAAPYTKQDPELKELSLLHYRQWALELLWARMRRENLEGGRYGEYLLQAIWSSSDQNC